MDLEEGINRLNGVLDVEIQGFFTERFINLCKINNIKIWNIKNIVIGIVRFSICIKDFKKLKKIAKKTKCKVKIIDKKGLYFKVFKYRKRKIVYLLILVCIISCIVFSSFIWNIEIVGNENISSEEILLALNKIGLKQGTCKIGLKSKNIINGLRINVDGIAWAGLEINGTKAKIKIVEKTNLTEDNREDGTVGDVVSTKSGVIEKVVVENGTSIQNVGDYIEENRIIIEGKVYGKNTDVKEVKAKGIIILDVSYPYSNTYSYKKENKKYKDKKKYSIGLTINEKENYINYLDKSINYDIIKNSYGFNIFSNKISFDLYEFDIYDVEIVDRSLEEIVEQAKVDANNYINEVMPNLRNPKIINEDVSYNIIDDENVYVNVTYTISEEDGIYRKRSTNE